MPRTPLEPRFQVDYLSILDAEGNLDASLEPKLPATVLKGLYRAMLLGRRLDERMVRLQRQGRIGTFAPIKGQEASQLGSICTLKPTDWMVPSFRETAAMIWRGWPIEKMLLFFAGYLEGGQPAPDQHDLPICIPVSTQLPHAVGLAYAAQYRNDDAVVMAYFGDGATSEGDFHEAVNFAAIHKLPVVFYCENNGYAISESSEKQMAVRHVADRAKGYNIIGVTVDGNDVLAVHQTVRWNIEECRRGRGPKLVEAKTYRLSPHTSSDDDRRYRTRAELEEWIKRDPIDRFRKRLIEEGTLTESDDAELRAQIKLEVQDAVKSAESAPDPPPEDALRHVFAEEG